MKISPFMRITIAIFITSIFLIRPYFLQNRGMWYVDDDYDYFAHSSAMVFGQYPSYTKEFFTINGGKGEPQSPIGTSILATPFVFAFSLLDRAAGSTITQTRTLDNVVGSWSQFGFLAGGIFYFVLACYILFAGISLVAAPLEASTAVIVMMICQGLPLFVYRRPFFSHWSEFFTQSALMYFFLVFTSRKLKGSSFNVLTAVIPLAGFLYLCRPNDLAFSLVWPFLVMDYSKGIIPILRQSRLGIVLLAAVMLIFKCWPDVVNHAHPYSWVGSFLWRHISFGDVCRRLEHIFIGTDWGLVFTAPFLLVSLAGLFLIKGPFLKRFFWLLLPMAVNFYIITVWGAQGGWYGYRYFIPPAIPVMTLPLAFALAWLFKRIHGWVIPLVILIALPPVLSMIAFEGCSYFNLHVEMVDFGLEDWTNPVLQSNIWAVLIHAPKMFWFIVSQGFMALFLSFTGKLPPLTQTTWVRVFIILFIPWLTYLICIFRRKIIK